MVLLRVKLAIGSCKTYELEHGLVVDDNETTIPPTTTTTIGQLKAIIAGLTSIPIAAQKLVYIGKILAPDEALFQRPEMLRECPTVTILVAPASLEAMDYFYFTNTSAAAGAADVRSGTDDTDDDENKVVLKFYSVKRKVYYLTVNPFRTTLGDARAQFEACDGWSRQYVDLVFRGTLLNHDDYHLIDYGIGGEAGAGQTYDIHAILQLEDNVGRRNDIATKRRLLRRLEAGVIVE